MSGENNKSVSASIALDKLKDTTALTGLASLSGEFDTPKIRALSKFCLDVMDLVSEAAGPFANVEASQKWHATYLAPQHVRDWIAQEQVSAFEANRTPAECAAWIYKNVTDKRIAHVGQQ